MLRRGIVAGVAALALGFVGAASAQRPRTHGTTVRMPEGAVVSVSEAPPAETLAPLPALSRAHRG